MTLNNRAKKRKKIDKKRFWTRKIYKINVAFLVVVP